MKSTIRFTSVSTTLLAAALALSQGVNAATLLPANIQADRTTIQQNQPNLENANKQLRADEVCTQYRSDCG